MNILDYNTVMAPYIVLKKLPLKPGERVIPKSVAIASAKLLARSKLLKSKITRQEMMKTKLKHQVFLKKGPGASVKKKQVAVKRKSEMVTKKKGQLIMKEETQAIIRKQLKDKEKLLEKKAKEKAKQLRAKEKLKQQKIKEKLKLQKIKKKIKIQKAKERLKLQKVREKLKAKARKQLTMNGRELEKHDVFKFTNTHLPSRKSSAPRTSVTNDTFDVTKHKEKDKQNKQSVSKQCSSYLPAQRSTASSSHAKNNARGSSQFTNGSQNSSDKNAAAHSSKQHTFQGSEGKEDGKASKGRVLEAAFKINRYPDEDTYRKIAAFSKCKLETVKRWFNKRRYREMYNTHVLDDISTEDINLWAMITNLQTENENNSEMVANDNNEHIRQQQTSHAEVVEHIQQQQSPAEVVEHIQQQQSVQDSSCDSYESDAEVTSSFTNSVTDDSDDAVDSLPSGVEVSAVQRSVAGSPNVEDVQNSVNVEDTTVDCVNVCERIAQTDCHARNIGVTSTDRRESLDALVEPNSTQSPAFIDLTLDDDDDDDYNEMRVTIRGPNHPLSVADRENLENHQREQHMFFMEHVRYLLANHITGVNGQGEVIQGVHDNLVNEVNMPAVNEVNTPAVNEVNTPAVNEVNTPAVNEVNMPAVNEANTPAVNNTEVILIDDSEEEILTVENELFGGLQVVDRFIPEAGFYVPVDLWVSPGNPILVINSEPIETIQPSGNEDENVNVRDIAAQSDLIAPISNELRATQNSEFRHPTRRVNRDENVNVRDIAARRYFIAPVLDELRVTLNSEARRPTRRVNRDPPSETSCADFPFENRLTKAKKRRLNEEFKKDNSPGCNTLNALSAELQLSYSIVSQWFFFRRRQMSLSSSSKTSEGESSRESTSRPAGESTRESTNSSSKRPSTKQPGINVQGSLASASEPVAKKKKQNNVGSSTVRCLPKQNERDDSGPSKVISEATSDANSGAQKFIGHASEDTKKVKRDEDATAKKFLKKDSAATNSATRDDNEGPRKLNRNDSEGTKNL